jgi:hypothetical protein
MEFEITKIFENSLKYNHENYANRKLNYWETTEAISYSNYTLICIYF